MADEAVLSAGIDDAVQNHRSVRHADIIVPADPACTDAGWTTSPDVPPPRPW